MWWGCGNHSEGILLKELDGNWKWSTRIIPPEKSKVKWTVVSILNFERFILIYPISLLFDVGNMMLWSTNLLNQIHTYPVT